MAKRLGGRFGYPPAPDQFKVTLHPELLDKPARWRKPRRVFVNSMSDLFHEDVPENFIVQIFITMSMSRRHTYLILTKRPERMLQFVGCWVDAHKSPLPNVWMGVSVEDQKTANERLPILAQIPAAKRFVSCEPLLGAVDLFRAMGEPSDEDWDVVNAIDDDNEPEEFIEECEDWINYGNRLVRNPEYREWENWRWMRARWAKLKRTINWVIVGGESGPGARPMDLEWAESIVTQCEVVGIPVFVKQLGGYPDKRNRMEEWPEELRVREWPEE
jgi:protein gp37